MKLTTAFGLYILNLKLNLNTEKAYKMTVSGVLVDSAHAIVYHTPTKEIFLKLGKKVVIRMAEQDIWDAVDVIDDFYAGSNYRSMLMDPKFVQLYDIGQRYVTVKFDTKWKTVACQCAPCFYCGIATPTDRIEIDHWFEQAAGRPGACLKVFRALDIGLTNGDATGRKAAAIKAGTYTKIGTRNKGPDLSALRLNSLRPNLQPKTKQSLTPLGQLFLSVIYQSCKFSYGDESKFFKFFTHSFINLVPTCPSCNKSKNFRLLSKYV